MNMVKSDPTLIATLVAAAKRGPSAADLYQQKVSFIASSLTDDKRVVTTEQVERELNRMAGKAA